MSARAELLVQLAEYSPYDETERGMWLEMQRFVEAEQDCFLRTCVPGHMTASAWVTRGGGREVLLMHHRKLDKWLQPGGHADGETDLLRVAAKEVMEETGVKVPEGIRPFYDIDVHVIPARGQDPEHLHYDIRFHWEVPFDTRIQGNDESREIRWVRIDQVLALNGSPSVMRMVHKCHPVL